MENKPVRLFLASSLPLYLSSWVNDISYKLERIDCDVKWVNPADCHMTLKFLGDTPKEKIKDIEASLKETLGQIKAIETHATTIGAFPRIERPEVVWIGLNDQHHEIEHLSKLIEGALEGLGFAKDDHDFIPHITIARVKSGRNMKTFTQALQTIKDVPKDTFTIKDVVLYQSTLTSNGPLYQILGQFPLLTFSQ